MENNINDLAERVAVLESRMDSYEHTSKETIKLLSEIKTKLDRWEGKIGGILFFAWCIWMFFSGFAKSVGDWLTMSGKG